VNEDELDELLLFNTKEKKSIREEMWLEEQERNEIA
jgi:hypothetical protein